MALLMGPVLSFRGCDDGRWNISAVVVSKTPPGALSAGGASVNPELMWEHKSGTAYRYRFALPMSNQPTTGTYTVDGETYDVAIPAAGAPPRMAYVSCNGFSALKLMKNVRDNNYLWTTMALKHGVPGVGPQDEAAPEVKEVHPYHLLLQGGDQVYADAMWETVPVMQAWGAKDWDAANKAKATDQMRKALDTFYFELYTDRWSQKEVQRMLARVPSIAIWDDHDLIDGWGSYKPERQNCPVYDAIWNSAAKAFAVFQQHLATGERRPGTIGTAQPDWWQQPAQQATRSGAFTFACTVGEIAILALDMRSQRTDSRVLSKEHWKEIYTFIDTLPAKKVKHFIVMSSIPVVYPGFDTLESLLRWTPMHEDLEDDLRDHWNSIPHKGERLRLIHNLLNIPDTIRVTLVSGDVHVAALGTIESERKQHSGTKEAVINQLISSGIVHPGPGGAVIFALQHLFDSADEIDRGIIGRMTQFPGNTAKFIGSRNYLSIEPDKTCRLWCNWGIENQRFWLTKVIHPS